MTCAETKRRLSGYHDQVLTPKLNQGVAGHLSDCSECQREYESFKRMLKVLSKLKSFDPPRSYVKKH
jgi:predicted anti-sigma-YlaC factor YlaD